MAFVSDLFDQLRDLLNDTADTQVPFATKKLYLNRGIARLWPAIGTVKEWSSLVVPATLEYLPPAALFDGIVISAELSRDAAGTDYLRFDDYELMPGDEDDAGVVRVSVSADRYFRIRYVAPIALIAAASYAAAQSETWVGPDRAMGLPVLYAMGMIAARKIDDRQDTNRYSTTQATNGVDDRDIIAASQTWFGQFEAELAAMERPLAPVKD